MAKDEVKETKNEKLKSIRLDKEIADKLGPYTLNQVLTKLRSSSVKIDDQNWYRLWREKKDKEDKKEDTKGAKSGKKEDAPVTTFATGVTKTNLELLQKIVSNLRKCNVIASYSDAAYLAVEMTLGKREERILSLNVQGVNVKDSDLIRKIKKDAKRINKLAPDIIHLQEFRMGEDEKIYNALIEELDIEYQAVLPLGYRKDREYNRSICLTLVRKNAEVHMTKVKIRDDFRNRMILFKMDGKFYMNVWIPQVFDVRSQNVPAAKAMWDLLGKLFRGFAGQDEEFYVSGDFNAFYSNESDDTADCMFSGRMDKVKSLLIDTRVPNEDDVPTCEKNVLDYAFVNRAAAQAHAISTRIAKPSFKEDKLSDHEGIMTVIKSV